MNKTYSQSINKCNINNISATIYVCLETLDVEECHKDCLDPKSPLRIPSVNDFLLLDPVRSGLF